MGGTTTRRTLIATLAVSAMLVLAGCGASGGGTPSEADTAAETTVTETPAPTPTPSGDETPTAIQTDVDDGTATESETPRHTPAEDTVGDRARAQFERFVRSVDEHYAGTVETARPVSDTTGYLAFGFVTSAETAPDGPSPPVTALAEATAETGGYPRVRFALLRQDGAVAATFTLNRSVLEGYADVERSRYQVTRILTETARVEEGFAEDSPSMPVYANLTADRVRVAWGEEVVDRLADARGVNGYRLSNRSYDVVLGGTNFDIPENRTLTVRVGTTDRELRRAIADTLVELTREEFWGDTHPGGYQLEHVSADGSVQRTYWPQAVVDAAATGELNASSLAGLGYATTGDAGEGN